MVKNIGKYFGLCCVFMAGGVYGQSNAVEISCPPTIQVHENIIQTPEGWLAGPDSARGHMLDDVDFGVISSKQALGRNDTPSRPDDEISKGDMLISVWKTDGSSDLYTKAGYAVFCSYHSTDIRVVKPIPPTLKECRTFTKVDKWHQYHFIKAVCK